MKHNIINTAFIIKTKTFKHDKNVCVRARERVISFVLIDLKLRSRRVAIHRESKRP